MSLGEITAVKKLSQVLYFRDLWLAGSLSALAHTKQNKWILYKNHNKNRTAFNQVLCIVVKGRIFFTHSKNLK